MKHKARVILFLSMTTLLLLSTALTGCGGAASDELWIAVVGPMTGENAQYGTFMRQAAELAVEEINAAGGVNGKTLMLQVEDDKMDPKEAAIVAEKLSGDTKVLAVVGHFSSSTSLAAIPIYDQNSLPMVTPSSTSPDLSGSSPYFFRGCVTDDLLGGLIGQFVIEELQPGTAAVMYSVSDGPIANKTRFIEVAEEAGIEIVADEAHDDSDKDFTAVLTNIASMEPDLVYLSTFYTPAALIAMQAKEVGLTDVEYIGMDGIYASDLISIAGEDAEGIMAGGFFHPDSPVAEAASFIAAYREKWGEDPEGYGANAYDIVYMIAEALENGGESREEIQTYLDKLGDELPPFVGATGPTGFDDNHDPVKAAVIARIEDGEWAYVTTVNP
jgi:branched-chain amino acid transport system substrate-binding protein